MSGSGRVDLGRVNVDVGWVNASGHMRAAQYVIQFEAAIERFLARIGLPEAEQRVAGAAPFLVEMHVCYRRELKAGEEVDISLQVLDLAVTRLHVIMVMQLAPSGRLVATTELDIVNIALQSRAPVPWPEPARVELEELRRAHAAIERPAETGRSIGAGRG